MKLSEIDELRQAGLISAEQREAIVRHFKLDRETNKLLLILGVIGAVMLCAGIILLVSANWDAIPKFLKLSAGITLLVGANLGAWRFGRTGEHPLASTTLYLVGAGLFLANIALVGQIYNLSSRPANAVLLWLIGIAPLPWILRLRSLHILTLVVFGVWLGLELEDQSGRLYFGSEERLTVFYAILAVSLAGLGGVLRKTRFELFAGSTEKFGLLGLQLASLPLMLAIFYRSSPVGPTGLVICAVTTLVAVIFLVIGTPGGDSNIGRGSKWIWPACLAGILGLAWTGLFWQRDYDHFGNRHAAGPHWVVVPAMFIFTLVQIQVGVRRRIPFFINLGVVFVAVQLLVAYFQLFGSMMDTGLIFITTGLLLLVLGWVLERKRRSLIRSLDETVGTNPLP